MNLTEEVRYDVVYGGVAVIKQEGPRSFAKKRPPRWTRR